MNWIDLVIVGVLAWTTFRAFSNGLLHEVVSLAALVLGVLLAGQYYDELAANLEFLVDDGTTRNLIGFAAIFLGTLLAGMVLGAVLKGVASMLLLGPLDHLGGAAFGAVKGVLFVAMMLTALSVFPAQVTMATGIDDSTLAPVFMERLPLVQVALPGEFSNPMEQLDQWRQLSEQGGAGPSETP